MARVESPEYVFAKMCHRKLVHVLSADAIGIYVCDVEGAIAFFAGIWTEWTSGRKLNEGETTNNPFAFLTTELNMNVAPIRPKAMPVILRGQDQIGRWPTAPPEEALDMQRLLPGWTLKIVAGGASNDGGGLYSGEW